MWTCPKCQTQKKSAGNYTRHLERCFGSAFEDIPMDELVPVWYKDEQEKAK